MMAWWAIVNADDDAFVYGWVKANSADDALQAADMKEIPSAEPPEGLAAKRLDTIGILTAVRQAMENGLDYQIKPAITDVIAAIQDLKENAYAYKGDRGWVILTMDSADDLMQAILDFLSAV